MQAENFNEKDNKLRIPIYSLCMRAIKMVLPKYMLFGYSDFSKPATASDNLVFQTATGILGEELDGNGLLALEVSKSANNS